MRLLFLLLKGVKHQPQLPNGSENTFLIAVPESMCKIWQTRKYCICLTKCMSLLNPKGSTVRKDLNFSNLFRHRPPSSPPLSKFGSELLSFFVFCRTVTLIISAIKPVFLPVFHPGGEHDISGRPLIGANAVSPPWYRTRL